MLTFEEIKNKFDALIDERYILENRLQNVSNQNDDNELENQEHENAIDKAKEQINELKKLLVEQLNDLVADDIVYISQNHFINCSRFNLQLWFLKKAYEMFKQNTNAFVPKIETKEEFISSIDFKLNSLEFSTDMEELNTLYLEYQANPDFIKNALIKAFTEFKIKELRKQISSINLEIQNSQVMIDLIIETHGNIDIKDNLINRLLKRKQLESQKMKAHHLNVISNLSKEKSMKEEAISDILENPNQFAEHVETELNKLKQFIEIYNLIKSVKVQISILEKTISESISRIAILDKTTHNNLEEKESLTEKIKDNQQKIYVCCKEISLYPEYVEKLYILAKNNSNKNINLFVKHYEEYLTQSVSELIN